MSVALVKKLVDAVNKLLSDRDALKDELRDLNIELERARSERSKWMAEAVQLEKAHKHQYNMAGLMLREAERTGRENDRLRAAGKPMRERLEHIGCHNCGRPDPRLAGSKPGTCKRCEEAIAAWDKAAMTDWGGPYGEPEAPPSEQGQGNLIDNIIRNR